MLIIYGIVIHNLHFFQDVGSDLYVVRGIEIGHEIVTAHLVDPHSEHLMDKIVLTVAELMSLHPPSPVFVINGALIHYKLIVIRHNTPIGCYFILSLC